MPCSDCKHYHKTDIAQGECRRYPPMLIALPVSSQVGFRTTPQLAGMFPPTKGDNWCGEHEKKVTLEAVKG
jgi:hypothetical protein